MTEIRNAVPGELEQILVIYDGARKFMRETGNPNQWSDHYPPRERVKQDIADGNCYVLTEDGEIAAVFCYFTGEDPTYRVIEDGAWLNDRPYGTIHRIASAGKQKGVAARCFNWAFSRCKNLRIDTHDDNKVMQHTLEKNGFIRCGRIYTEEGAPRVAFQKTEA